MKSDATVTGSRRAPIAEGETFHAGRRAWLRLAAGAGTSVFAGCESSSPFPSPGSSPTGENQRELLRRAAGRGLVDVRTAVPGALVSLPYATPRNVTGRRLYPADMPCLLHRATAEKAARAQAWLAPRGLRLRIWDAWRPAEVQRLLWSAPGGAEYVRKPGPDGVLSWHCHGRALDVTLADADGRNLRMPSGFDDFSGAASALYTGPDEQIVANLTLLQNAMGAAGFAILTREWWHFEDPVIQRPPPPVTAAELGLRLP